MTLEECGKNLRSKIDENLNLKYKIDAAIADLAKGLNLKPVIETLIETCLQLNVDCESLIKANSLELESDKRKEVQKFIFGYTEKE